MRRNLLLLGFTAILSVAVPDDALACSCIPSGPPCQQAWSVPLIFAGQVLSIESTDPANRPFGPKRVRFQISESFRGVEKGEVDIHLGGATCDPDFIVGQEYLVYGHHRGGGPGWTTSICTRTRLLQGAGEDLQYLRLADNQKGSSRIVGQVLHQSFDLSTANYRSQLRPLPGVRVKVTNGTIAEETITDAEGHYSIAAPALTLLDVTFISPDGFSVEGGRRVVIPEYRACAGVDGYARYDGRVSGTLVDKRGLPLPFFPLSLASTPRVALGGFEKHVLTDVKGRFEFTGVDPTTYVVAPSRQLWGQAETLPPLTSAAIAVAPAVRLDAGRLVFPSPPETALLEGVLVDSAGRPVADASVTVRAATTRGTVTLTTDATGTFRISVIAGRSYDLQASLASHGWGRTPEEALTAVEVNGRKTVRLQLKKVR
jgi:hypothetical protein